MPPAYPRLTTHLRERGVDAYLLDADGETSDQYYLSGYHAPDPFVTLYADGEVVVLVSGLEYQRAIEESAADAVRKTAEFYTDEIEAMADPRVASKHVTAAFLADYDVDAVLVPDGFPAGTADVLREAGVTVEWDDDYVLAAVRAVKTDEEVERIRATQRANETAVAAVADLLERATVADGGLRLDDAPLTSERVRERIEVALLEQGCRTDDCIVAAGPAAARGHDSGAGQLPAGEPVIVDIFPRDGDTRYCADMTRTFCKGAPTERARERYDLVHAAYEAALDTIEAGVTGEAVDDAVCDVFEDAGYATPRDTDAPEDGFTHSTGHGVGLDVHEAPYLAQSGGELRPGHVVTVEPGLYEQGWGGVRLEDLLVVREGGYENLTDYPTDLQVV